MRQGDLYLMVGAAFTIAGFALQGYPVFAGVIAFVWATIFTVDGAYLKTRAAK